MWLSSKNQLLIASYVHIPHIFQSQTNVHLCTHAWTCTNPEHSSKTQKQPQASRVSETGPLQVITLQISGGEYVSLRNFPQQLHGEKSSWSRSLVKKTLCPKQHSALIFGMEPVPLVAMCSPTLVIRTLLGGEVSEAVWIIRIIWIIQMSHIRLNIYMHICHEPWECVYSHLINMLNK